MKSIHLLLCAWGAWTSVAAANLPVRLNPDAWTLQTQNPEDGSVRNEAGTLVLRRGSKGREAYLTRAYQDLPVTGGRQLLLRVAARVEGPGSFRALVHTAGSDGKWDEAGMQRGAPLLESPEEKEYRSVFTVPEDAVKIRLSLILAGENSRATLHSVFLEELGKHRQPTVDPSPEPVAFDGRAAGPFWETAEVLTPFRVLGDVARRSALHQEARVAVRDGYLYLSGRFEEPDPAGIRAGQKDVLAIYGDDCAEIFLSTDRVAYSHVLVNAAGAKYWDLKIDGRPSPTWYPSVQTDFRGDWDARAAVGENEWTWEFRVRINDLFERAVGGEQTLFVNIARHRPRDAEPYSTWAPLAGASFHVPREFQAITLRLPEASENDLLSVPPGVFTQRLSVPDLLISGRPLLLTKGAEKFLLPSECEIQDGVGLAESVLTDLRDDLSVGRGPKAVVTLALGDLVADADWTDEQRRRFEGPEAFRLNLTPGRAEIAGRTREGILRGIATLRLLARRARIAPGMSLPGMILADAPALPYRGFMLHFSDPIKSVKRNLDALFLLRMNKAVFDLSSHGARTWFPFESMAVGRSDRTKEDWAEIFQYARDRGIEPIPYMHSWSRVQYFRHAPEPTAHLYVEDKGSELYPWHRSLDVARPETHPFMLNLQKEIVELLRPEEFHIAMDETHFSRTIVSEAAIARGWKPSDWYVEAVTVNDRFLKDLGVKRMSIWGDMIDIGQNGRHMDMHGLELLARLPKDLTIYDWKYEGQFDHATEFPSIAFFKNAGYRTIGCPWFRPNNVARIAHSVYRAGAEGLLLTAWSDTNLDRLSSEMIRAAGLAGYLSWTPEDADLSRFPFVADTLLGAAAYWTDLPEAAAETRSLPPPVAGLTTGPALLRLLGLPDRMAPDFLLTPFADARGVTVHPFLHDGRPAAIAVRGAGHGFRNSDFSRGLSGWTIQTPGPEGRFEIDNEDLVVTRVSGREFMRAYADVPLDPDLAYRIRFRAKTEGSPGVATVTLHAGDSRFNFAENTVVTRAIQEREWTEGEIHVPARSGSIRISLSVTGEGATARFQGVDLMTDDATNAAPVPVVPIPVGRPAARMTFLHTTNPQPIQDNMGRMATQFNALDPGSYRVVYEDGTTETIWLDYRRNITAVNDSVIGRQGGVGLFGTVGDAHFVNIPTFTWTNPYPEKQIRRIDVLPGSAKGSTLLLFGVALE